MNRTPRQIADDYVDQAVLLNPIEATMLGLEQGQDRLPDLSPAGAQAMADLQQRVLDDLTEAERVAGGRDRLEQAERRCAVLLRERLDAALALHEAGDHLRLLNQLDAPLPWIRNAFTLMPTATAQDWSVLAARLRAVPAALAGYQETLGEGLNQKQPAGPTQVRAVIQQLDDWLGEGPGRDWFTGFVAAGPAELSRELGEAAGLAAAAHARLRDWLREEYQPALGDAVDPVGPERYARAVRFWNGAELDPTEAYAWGWTEFARIDADMRLQAERVLPGSTPQQAMDHLNLHGPAIEGVEEIRTWLQRLMDDTIAAMHGVHLDIAEPVRTVQSMIAPEGSAAAAYYTVPAADFSRPGRTWLPTLGRTRFPTWNLVSIWYHEGVPGHHLQLGQWVHAAPRLSRFQTASSLAMVSANVEGWALYAERLMDELGFLDDPAARLGYLAAQQARAIRVIIDIGLHLQLPIPADQGVPDPFEPGATWTPALAETFLARGSGFEPAFVTSEVIRYLGMPGQAISYKIGERAWLQGRELARQRHGAGFDLRRWHTAALDAGSLGLDALVEELAGMGGPLPG